MSNYEAGMWIWSVLYGYGHVSDADTFKQSFYGDNNYAFVHIDGVSAVLSLSKAILRMLQRYKHLFCSVLCYIPVSKAKRGF